MTSRLAEHASDDRRGTHLVRIGEAAERVYGRSDRATTERLRRATARGALRAVRVGDRGDRWYSTAELDRLVASAES